MRFKGTIFLTVLLIFLGFYLYYVEFPAEQKKQEEALKKAKLFSFGINEISRLNIKNAKGAVELEYFPDHKTAPWRIFLPVETIANKYAADDLALLLESLKASRLVEEQPSQLEQFGLDPPIYRVLITINQFDTLIVEVGDENLTGSDVYVKKGMGTSLYLVPAGIKKILDKDLKAWRRKEIFPSEPEEVQRIRISSSRGVLDLSKKTEGWSFMSNPSKKEGGKRLGTRGSLNEVANLLGSILNLRGEDFIDFGKESWKTQFGAPTMKITLRVNEVEREGFFYKDQAYPDEVFVVTSPFDPIYAISDSVFKSIDQPFNIYRDKHLIPLDFPDQIEAFTIERPTESFSLKKKEGKWMLQGKNLQEVKETRTISRFLTDIYNLRLEKFRDDLSEGSPKTGLRNPEITIHLQGKDEKTLGRIDFGQIIEERVIGKSSGQTHLFSLKKEIAEQIPHKKDFLGSTQQ